MRQHATTLVAIKPLTYGTRRLRAGDEFEAIAGHAHILQIAGLATEAPERFSCDGVEDDRLDFWRDQFNRVFGKPCDGRWGVKKIREAIGERG